MLAFGFLLLNGGKFISKGIDCSMSVWGGGLPTSSLLIGKTLPASFVILTMAFAKNQEDAEVRAQMGMGLVAGTTALMLSLLWGLIIIAGRCDLFWNGLALDRRLTVGRSLTETGVTILPTETARAIFSPVWIVLPYLVTQIPVAVGWSDGRGYFPLLLSFGLSLFVRFTTAGYYRSSNIPKII